MSLPYESSVQPAADPHGPSTRRDIAALACRIIAVYLLTHAALNVSGGLLATLAGLWEMVSEQRMNPAILVGAAMYLVPAIGMALAGWLLWAKARRLAIRMVPDDSVFDGLGHVTPTDLLSIALSISGVFLFIDSVQHALRNFALISQDRPLTYWQSTPAWNQMNWSAGVELIFAIWLVFGSRGIAAMIRKLRNQDPPHHSGNPTQE